MSNNEVLNTTESGEVILDSVLAELLGHVQDLQQQAFVAPVLCRSARVQLEGRSLEEGQGFGQRPQLYQVQEVEVPKPLGPLAGRQLRVETPAEL